VLALSLAGWATAQPLNPFQISEEQFRTQVKRIALVPIAVPPQLGVSESAKLRFDSLIEAKLLEAGFATFPAKNWGDALARMQQEVGGIVDARTGGLDETKAKTAWTSTADEVRSRFQFDAVLLPRIHVVPAEWRFAVARWDGVSEVLASGLAVFGAPETSGTIRALSLVVSIGSADIEGPAQYRHRAGIQVLEKFSPTMAERLSGKMLTPLAPEELLANDERNRAAVEIALGPLVKKR
jgi:hypothetical protein